MGKRYVCRTDQIPPNGMKAFALDDGPRVLVLSADGEYFAYQAMCPHQDVPLEEGVYDGCTLTCHQHLWQWDVRTGAPVGMAELPLEFYEVQIEDGALYVLSPSALDQCELFKDLPERVRHEIGALAARESHAAGGVIYAQGDPARDLYVLETGLVEFRMGRDGRTSGAGFAVRKGEVFGWAALMENQSRRLAEAVCLEAADLYRLDGEALGRVFEEHPAAGYRVMRRLMALVTRHLAESAGR